ncbi:hypothetical protein EV702DRAFT_1042815 [Suillus placidus]|uniref:Uncharacterized protein n=1 Tax=Suillus placidus TaxID=48579 RepID=A0A9P7A1D1_9AGAM|nr:hypothetical protein EV702DRAFT_1042815 [Suillus placidus]
MRFSALIALAIVASTVPSLAAPTPYSSERHTASTDNNTVVGTSVRNGCVPLRFGRVILPGDNLSLDSKRDTTSDIVQAIEAVLNELPPARKRDITADITAALQTLLTEGGSVLNDVKRDSASSDVENRSFKALKVKPSVSTVLGGAGSVVSIGAGLADIWGLADSKNSTRRDLDQTFDEVNVGGALNGAALQFEDRSFKSHSSAGSILKDGADIVGAAAAAASFISAIDGSGNSTKRDLGMDSGRIGDQRRAVVSDIESILQLIISSFEGAGSTSTSTPTSIKRSTSKNGFLGLTDIIIPEQLDELS